MVQSSADKPGGKKGQRQLRVAEAIRHALADLLRRGDFRDPALNDLALTITEARISPDLKAATVFVSQFPVGTGEIKEREQAAEPSVIKALNHAAPFLRSRVGEMLRLRFAPALRFVADDRLIVAAKIHALLQSDDVVRDLSLATPARDPS